MVKPTDLHFVVRLMVPLALLMAVLGMSRTFGEPFHREMLGHNGARYAHIAQNYERWGLTHLGGAPLLNTVKAPSSEEADVYAHHPPGLTWTMALVNRALGAEGEPYHREDRARLVPAVATLLGILLLASLVSSVSDRLTGGLAAILFAAMPMISVYGAHPDPQGPVVLTLSLLVVWSYLRWRGGGSLYPVILASVAASGFDWYGLYAPLACGIHLGVTDSSRRRDALGLCVLPLLLFGGWAWWLTSLPEMSWDRLSEAASIRIGSQWESESAVFAEHLSRWWKETMTLMPGWPGLLAAALAVSCGRLLPPSLRPGSVQGQGLVAMLVAPPLVHALIFPTGAVVHSYWLFGLPAALAAAVALSLQRVRPGMALAGAAILVFLGLEAQGALLKQGDRAPSLLGELIAEATDPEEVILTNYPTNVLLPHAAGYVMRLPEVTFYSDRKIRGGVETEQDFSQALETVPDATMFLLVNWPVESSPDLATAVERQCEADPLLLHPDGVWLYRLRP